MSITIWDSSNLKQLFSALSNSKRLAILTLLLQNGTLKIDDIAFKLRLPYKTAVRNLDMLRRCGLVTSRHYKSALFYNLNTDSKDDEILLTLALVNMAYIGGLKEEIKSKLSKKAKRKIDEYMSMSFRPTLANIAKFFGQNI